MCRPRFHWVPQQASACDRVHSARTLFGGKTFFVGLTVQQTTATLQPSQGTWQTLRWGAHRCCGWIPHPVTSCLSPWLLASTSFSDSWRLLYPLTFPLIGIKTINTMLRFCLGCPSQLPVGRSWKCPKGGRQEPPQLTPFDVEEQRLYSEILVSPRSHDHRWGLERRWTVSHSHLKF